MNNEGPYTINALHNGILTGYTTLNSSNLIVENIMMNDGRNGSEYRCVVIPAQGMMTFADIMDESDPTTLYVAGEYSIVLMRHHIRTCMHSFYLHLGANI